MVTHMNQPGPCAWVPSSLRFTLRVVSAVGLAAALAGRAQAQTVSPPTDLGTLGGCCSAATDINNVGQVVGFSFTSMNSTQHAFLWTAVGGMVDLGTLGGTFSYAQRINNAGQVVGYSYTASDTPHAFLWTAADGMVDLGTLGGTYSTAQDINDAGQVVGGSYTAIGAFHAFLWTTRGMVDLGVLDAVNSLSEAVGINRFGQVAGYSMVNGYDHAFLWTAMGGMVDLGTLGGFRSRASEINDFGQVVGSSQTVSGESHAFSWTASGGMVDLGTLGGASSQAFDINNAGQVVGVSLSVGGQNRAFVWTAVGGMVDIGTLGGCCNAAYGINDAGQVAGWDAASGHIRAAIWSVCLPSPPVIADASVSPSVLWPPNHQMIRVRVDYTVTTSCGATATTALSVVSNEADNGRGDGNSSGDAVVVDDHTVLLRAERAGPGDGRTYTIRIRTTDSEGQESTATQTVWVPKNTHRR